VTRWLLVLAAWVALELVVLYGGAWLAHKVVPPWAFSPTLLLNFVLLVAVGGAIFCYAISKPKRPRPTTAGAPSGWCLLSFKASFSSFPIPICRGSQ